MHDRDQIEIEDTIVALASAAGAAGVAVVRLSGRDALGVMRQMFRARGRGGEAGANVLVYGTVLSPAGESLDDCLVVEMPGPRSFTGEDVAEIQCHGSPAIVRAIIETCLHYGARMAQPGEFSRRAFLNGKMDLTQAEALSDLIAAQSEAARRLALRQLRGGLGQRLRAIYSELLDAAAEIEAHIDFPDEDIPQLAQDAIRGRMERGYAEIQALLSGYQKARLKSEGIRVVLAGSPNAGKSSLFNAIVGRERAIVSPHAGTTRDTIETTVEMNGIAVTLVDTAGIRDDAGEVEQIGIDRTFEEIGDADLVLHLVECGEAGAMEIGTASLEGIDPERVLLVRTKTDLVSDAAAVPGNVHLSSATGQGLAQLEEAIVSRLQLEGGTTDEPEMSRARHAENLTRALASLDLARGAFEQGESGDLVMIDLRDALSFLGETFGERLDEQILDRIFSTFCLGK